ncbi:MAG: FN3 associated domain-containing protein [Haliscomenobacter sp.]
MNLGIFSEPTFLEIRSKDPHATIYYTLDQTEPTSASIRYQQAIPLTHTTHVRAMAQQPGKVASPVVKGEFRLSRFNNLRYQHPYAGQYTGGGPLGLLDGKKGSSRFSDGNWQGFEGHDFIGDIDLGKAQNPKEVRMTFLQDLGAWIFSPQWVKVFGSNDGSTWTEINQVQLPIPDVSSSNAAQIIPIQLTIPAAAPIRYLRIHGKSQGVCPPWHAGAGGKAWLFIDEIEIN